jgi:hypothetical protein
MLTLIVSTPSRIIIRVTRRTSMGPSATISMPVWCMCIWRSSPRPPVAVISGDAALMRGPGSRPALISLRNTISRRGFDEAAE